MFAFAAPPEHIALRSAVRDFAIQEIEPVALENDRAGTAPLDLLEKLARRWALVPTGEIVDAMRVIASRCGEIGRDPETLRVSVHIWWEALEKDDPVRLLRAYREAGVARVMTLVRRPADDDEALDEFRRIALQAGASLAG